MRRPTLVGLALVGLALVGVLLVANALIERRRQCDCPADCWCRTPWGRRFRWVLPLRHRCSAEDG